MQSGVFDAGPGAKRPGTSEKPEAGSGGILGPSGDGLNRGTAGGALMAFHEYLAELYDNFLFELQHYLFSVSEVTGSASRVPYTVVLAAANAYLDLYGDNFGLFKGDWKWQRLLTPLQGRLMMEQILWDRGLPWRSLITGFRAIEGDAGETGVVGPPDQPETQTPSPPHAQNPYTPGTLNWDRWDFEHRSHGH